MKLISDGNIRELLTYVNNEYAKKNETEVALSGKAERNHSHSASEIDARPSYWVPSWEEVTSKPNVFNPVIGTSSTTAFRGDYGQIAYSHALGEHAPSDAQKNSDITKGEVEAKLTGDISTHNHDSNYYSKNVSDSKFIGFKDESITNANYFTKNGYVKTNGNQTYNLPPECSTSTDKWGVLQYLSENDDNKTGVQMFYPTDGDNRGRMFMRSFKNNIPGDWKKVMCSGDPISGIKPNWDDITGKPGSFTPILGTTQWTAFRGDYGNIAYNHSQSAHAPSNAQKNSDITKWEIENKLTGDISSHNHDTNYYSKSASDAKFVGFKDGKLTDANYFKKSGFAKMDGNYGYNLPPECSSSSDRWGVIQYLSENDDDQNGVQMFYPTSGSQKGRMFIRDFRNGTPGQWKKVMFSGEQDSGSGIKLVKKYPDYYGNLTLSTDKYQTADMQNNLRISLPYVSDFIEIHFFINMTSNYTIQLPSCQWQSTPKLSSGYKYELIFTNFNGTWLGGVIKYG